MDESRIINYECRKHLPYISATKLKNYILKDPIIDYLEYINSNTSISLNENKLHKSSHLNDIIKLGDLSELSDSSRYLCDLGNQFETDICNELKLKFKDDMIKISTNGRMGYNRENYNKTIKAINDRIPIIEQAVLYNDNNGTCGIADLLVRKDYLNKILNINIIDESEDQSSYVVIDIKYTTLELCRDDKSIKNIGRIPSYKTQLGIYNMALAEIQNYLPSKAYILAKAYKSVNGTFTTYDKLGIIDYNGYDKWCDEEIKLAIDWLTDLMTTSNGNENGNENGNGKWNINKPHRWELYPNMSNHYDDNYHYKKLEIANNINELTLIWNVGFANRIKAHNLNIYSYKDPRCSSITLGIKNRRNAEIIDHIININRTNSNYLIHGNEINNLININESCYYIDFETINNFVFMIGVGHITKSINISESIWTFKTFQVSLLTDDEQNRIFNEFISYVGINKTLFHWSNAELSITNSLIEKLNGKLNGKSNGKSIIQSSSQCNLIFSSILKSWTISNNWIDLCKLFTNNIVIKGALDFKLKTVAKALKNLNLIKESWDIEGPQNGFDAMVQAIKYYSNNQSNNQNNNQIIKYNENDCKILHSIHEWLKQIT
jgi:hypothetical protein